MKTLFAAVLLLVLGLSTAMAAAPVLRIAVDSPYPPFAYTDPETGKLTGFDYDIAVELCRIMNRECEIVVVPFDNIIPEISAQKIDIGVAGMAKTAEREEKVLFSDKYFRSSSVFVGFPGSLEPTVEGLRGKKIGVQHKTTQETYLRKTFGDVAQIVTFSSFDEIMSATLNKTIDVAFVDGLPGYSFLKTDKGEHLDVVGEPIMLGSGSCVVLNKSLTKERDAINEAIQTMRKSGRYDVLNRKYFEFNVY